MRRVDPCTLPGELDHLVDTRPDPLDAYDRTTHRIVIVMCYGAIALAVILVCIPW